MTEISDLNQKMDLLIRITAAGVVQNKPLKEQVRLLDSVGIKPKEIAAILGKTSNHINVTLHALRKEPTRKAGEGNNATNG